MQRDEFLPAETLLVKRVVWRVKNDLHSVPLRFHMSDLISPLPHCLPPHMLIGNGSVCQ